MTSTATDATWIAVAGNPNSGKSTLFNQLTGSDQKVANYPGVTVEKKIGHVSIGERDVTVVDVPGSYSLAAASEDEQIVTDILTGRMSDIPSPDAIVVVVDAVNLRRNLYFCSQVADLGVPIVIALNMYDLAEAQGLKIDTALLEKNLGVPVVPTCATSGRGLDGIKDAIGRALSGKTLFADLTWPDAVHEAAAEIRKGDNLRTFERLRLLFDAQETGPDIKSAREYLRKADLDPVSVEAVHRYRHIDALLDGVVTKPDPKEAAKSYAIDRLLTHRFWGMLTFIVIMLGVFSSIYWMAGPAMDGIDWLFGLLGETVGAWLEGTPWLQSLVVDGIIAGVGGVVIFLPQILILFLFIAFLEDTGYMARAAFLMDKVFAWTGLNGKSFVPLLSSYACAVPAIMGCRTIEDPRARLSTILVSPLMSCSARLPVYVLLIGAFVEPSYGAIAAGVALFGMHMLGLLVAIPIAFVINRFMLKMRTLPFLMELPPYRRPRWRDVFRRMWDNGSEFVVRAGTIILAFSIVIWALMYFPATDAETPTEQLEASYLGSFGKTVQPVFEPAGYDWKITVGVIASFPAREVIISTLGIIYSVEEEDEEGLKATMAHATWPDGSPVYTPWVAASIMVFFALCLQCGSTVAVIAKEVGWKWATFAFVYMTGLAWVGAVATYQLGNLFFGGGSA